MFTEAVPRKVAALVASLEAEHGIVLETHVERDYYGVEDHHGPFSVWVYAPKGWEFAAMECGTAHEARTVDILPILRTLRKVQA